MQPFYCVEGAKQLRDTLKAFKEMGYKTYSNVMNASSSNRNYMYVA